MIALVLSLTRTCCIELFFKHYLLQEKGKDKLSSTLTGQEVPDSGKVSAGQPDRWPGGGPPEGESGQVPVSARLKVTISRWKSRDKNCCRRTKMISINRDFVLIGVDSVYAVKTAKMKDDCTRPLPNTYLLYRTLLSNQLAASTWNFRTKFVVVLRWRYACLARWIFPNSSDAVTSSY